MRAYAAVWVFCLALAGGPLLYSRKISGDTGETGSIHQGLRKLAPHLQRGQQLHLLTDANEGMRLIHARLELAPGNLFLAKRGATPDTVLTISNSDAGSFPQEQYRRLAAVAEGTLYFKLYARRP